MCIRDRFSAYATVEKQPSSNRRASISPLIFFISSLLYSNPASRNVIRNTARNTPPEICTAFPLSNGRSPTNFPV